MGIGRAPHPLLCTWFNKTFVRSESQTGFCQLVAPASVSCWMRKLETAVVGCRFMKLGDIYHMVVEMGIKRAPRGEDRVREILNDSKEKYEKLEGR